MSRRMDHERVNKNTKPKEPENTLMPFGKYQNRTVKWILRIIPVISNGFVQSHATTMGGRGPPLKASS